LILSANSPFFYGGNANGQQENDQTPECDDGNRGARNHGNPGDGQYHGQPEGQSHRVPQRQARRQIARYRPDQRQWKDQAGPVQLGQPGQVCGRPELGR